MHGSSAWARKNAREPAANRGGSISTPHGHAKTNPTLPRENLGNLTFVTPRLILVEWRDFDRVRVR